MKKKKYYYENYEPHAVFSEEGYLTLDENYKQASTEKESKPKKKRLVVLTAIALVAVLALAAVFTRGGGNSMSFTSSNAAALKSENEKKKAEEAEKFQYTSETAPWFSTDGYGRLFFDQTLFEGTELIIPAIFDSYTVTTVSYGFDEKNKTIEKLTVQEGVSDIREDAFSKFSALKEVSLPSSISRVIGKSFHGTPWYKELNEEFCTVGNGVLIKYCGNGGNVTIPEQIRVIDCEVFADKTDISSILFPQSAICVGSGVFDGCTAENIVVNSGLSTADNSAFFGSAWLDAQNTPCIIGNGILIKQSVENGIFEIPDEVVYVSGIDFSDIDESITVKIGRSTRSIADIASLGYASDFTVSSENSYYSTRGGILYNNDKSIIYRYPVYLDATVYRAPETVRQIANAAFEGCRLEKIELNDGITVIGNRAFSDAEKLEKFQMPGTVSQIGYSVFKNCKALKTVQLSEGLRRIPRETFRNCESLTKLSASDLLTDIKEYAFDGCKQLPTFTITKAVSHIATSAFDNCDELTLKIEKENVYFELVDNKPQKRVLKSNGN